MHAYVITYKRLRAGCRARSDVVSGLRTSCGIGGVGGTMDDPVTALPAPDPPPPPPARLDERTRLRSRSEAALVRGALAGVEADLAELFRRHWRDAYRTAYF